MEPTAPQPDKYRPAAATASVDARPRAAPGIIGLLAVMVIALLAGPPGCSPAAPTSPPAAGSKTTDVGGGFIVDRPSDWVDVPRGVADIGFTPRGGNMIYMGFAPAGGKPTQMPYAIVEGAGYRGMSNPTRAQQQAMADQVAAMYETAFNPPSRADRPPLWKGAKVSRVSFDPINNRFHFTATITYDLVGDVIVDVSGVFAARELAVMSIWSDAEYHEANAKTIAAFGNSLRLGTAPSPIMSMRARMLRLAQIIGAAIIVSVVLLQVVVLVRERRERQRDEARLSGE